MPKTPLPLPLLPAHAPPPAQPLDHPPPDSSAPHNPPPSTAQLARKLAADTYLPRSAVTYLLLVAQKPFDRPSQICRESGSHVSTLYKWRLASAYFRELEAAIRADPDVAANFALRYAQPGAVAALIANLPRGGRTATDAASALLREGRERGESVRRSRLAEALERMMQERTDSDKA